MRKDKIFVSASVTGFCCWIAVSMLFPADAQQPLIMDWNPTLRALNGSGNGWLASFHVVAGLFASPNPW